LHRERLLPAVPLYSLLEWRGALWVGGVSSLYQITGSGVKSVPAPEGAGTQVTHLAVHDDSLWAGTSRGLYRSADGPWARAAGDPPALRLGINALYADSDGTFWVSSNAGLARLTGDKLQQFVRGHDATAADDVESMFEDREHDLWFGTHALGVSRLWNGYT